MGLVAVLLLAFQFLQPVGVSAATQITLNPTSGAVGAPVNVTGSGFQTNETVTITFAGSGTVATTTAAGASGSIAVTFNVPNVAPGFYTIRATGQTSGVTATAQFQVLGSTAPLTLQKTVQVNGGPPTTSASASPGASLTYTLTYRNTGTTTATDVTITDTLAAGQTLNHVSAGCTATLSSGLYTVKCPVGSVVAGGTGFVQIVTTVQTGFSGTILNSANVTESNTGATTVNSNQTTITVAGTATTATLTKTVSVNANGYSTTGSAQPGATLSYAIVFTNTSTNNATINNVVINDQIQPGQTLLGYPATSSSCTTFTSYNQTLSCPIGNVAAGQSVRIFIGTQVNAGFYGTITNRATASNGGGSATSNQTVVTVNQQAGYANFILCGPVTSYSGSTITISGVTVNIAFGAAANGTPSVGSNECVTFSFNSSGQATSFSVSQNLAFVGVACGVYSPSSLAGTIYVSGIRIAVASGNSFQSLLVPGDTYCFLLTSNGVAYAALNGIPTSAHVRGHAGVYRHGMRTAV